MLSCQIIIVTQPMSFNLIFKLISACVVTFKILHLERCASLFHLSCKLSPCLANCVSHFFCARRPVRIVTKPAATRRVWAATKRTAVPTPARRITSSPPPRSKRVGGAGIHRGMFDKDFQGFCLKSMIFRQKTWFLEVFCIFCKKMLQ